MSVTSASPVRNPDLRDTGAMTKRGWILVVLNLLIPGSAQLLAGNRRLGRFGVGATFVLWALAIIAGLLYAFLRTVIYTIASTPVALWGIAALLVFYGVLWVVLTLDTLRLVRLVKTVPVARPAIAILTVAALVVTAGGAAYGAFVATTASGFISDTFVAAPPEPPVDGRYNIMLLGGDAGADRTGLRPDSMTVVSIDAETGAATLIGLPRNMEKVPFVAGSPMAEKYPNGYGVNGCEVDVCLLNSIYTEVELVSPEMYPNAVAEGSLPGIEGMRDALEGITGLTIQYYGLIDMAGFSELIDALGGVTINVPVAVPIHTDDTFTTVLEYIGPGVVHMNGYYALWYARSRHDTSDYDRMARQRQIQEAIVEQANPANVLSKFQAIAAAGSQVVKTDIPQGTLGYFVELAGKTKSLPISSLELVPANDVVPEDPDFGYIRELVAAALAPAPDPEKTG